MAAAGGGGGGGGGGGMLFSTDMIAYVTVGSIVIVLALSVAVYHYTPFICTRNGGPSANQNSSLHDVVADKKLVFDASMAVDSKSIESTGESEIEIGTYDVGKDTYMVLAESTKASSPEFKSSSFSNILVVEG